MNSRKNIVSLLLLGLTLIIPLSTFADMDADDELTKRGTVDDDYYAAGGEVDIEAEIAGDLVTAGGDLFIGRRIEGDVMAAGGIIKIRGEVKDDVRIAGGQLNIDAIIGDDLAASGGSIKLSPGTSVGGEAWLAGGDVTMAGTITKNLKIIAGNIRLSGTVHGDVELEGGDIQILEGAQIYGNLHYRSPGQAGIDPNAGIVGELTHEVVEWDYSEHGFGILFSLTLVAAAILLFWLFPKFTVSSASRIASEPWKSLGVGTGLLLVTPVIAIILMTIVLGVWIGLSVLALYCVALLLGFLIACFFVADRGAKLMKKDIHSTGSRLVSVTLAIILIGFVSIIPVIGGLMLFALLLLGLGAGASQLRFVYRHSGDEN
ncbi:MAG: hypothetical protein HKN34_07335 [Gammaproteobacteria bacterium]|nr:hypothetical protein [Gammaproteobacteria bacterium]